MNDLRIRPMRSDEISIVVDWAAAEGWNPGFADAACFAAVDPLGFFIGEVEGVPVATVCCVNYNDHFSFLGFYIVRADLRGSGYGLSIWHAAMAHAGPRVIGLDGVVAQQQNYRRSGFELAYANVRYGGTVAAPAVPQARAFPSEVDTGSRQENASNQKFGVVALSEIPLPAVAAYDATVIGNRRAQRVRRFGLSKTGDVVVLAFDRHQRHAADL